MGKNRIQYFDTPILNDFLKNVELDSKYDFEKAFQKALDVARDSEDKNTIYRI